MFAKLIAALPLIAACSTISSVPPPADWPPLSRTVITMSTDDDMRSMCKGSDGVVASFNGVACAIVSFGPMTCLIVESRQRPMTQEIRQHEGADGKDGHCQGRDHIGEDTLRRAWETWKSKQEM